MSADRTNQRRTSNDTLPPTDAVAHTEQSGHTIYADSLDQTLVCVDQATWDYFMSVLDQPPDNPELSKLMQTPTPWNQ